MFRRSAFLVVDDVVDLTFETLYLAAGGRNLLLQIGDMFDLPAGGLAEVLVAHVSE